MRNARNFYKLMKRQHQQHDVFQMGEFIVVEKGRADPVDLQMTMIEVERMLRANTEVHWFEVINHTDQTEPYFALNILFFRMH